MGASSPSKFEFDILSFLCASEGLTVRELYEQFGKSRGYVRGTMVKGIDRLFRKGLVERSLDNGVFVYKAVPGKTQMERDLVDSFIRERLGGRIAPLLAYFSEEGAIKPSELEEIRRMLDLVVKEDQQS